MSWCAGVDTSSHLIVKFLCNPHLQYAYELEGHLFPITRKTVAAYFRIMELYNLKICCRSPKVGLNSYSNFFRMQIKHLFFSFLSSVQTSILNHCPKWFSQVILDNQQSCWFQILGYAFKKRKLELYHDSN